MKQLTKMSNRLINEKSPYLLQHAHNPVDWFPWSEEAFSKAKEEDKPIFLSIGYSTCHWCHVMAHESFEDEEVAELLNKHFIAIKVDREERPDIDSVYMTVCQVLTGEGGWPLTIIMAPDKKPFFAGTYFPKTARYNRPGMLELLEKIGSEWKEYKEKWMASSEQIVASLKEDLEEEGKAERITKDSIDKTVSIFKQIYDEEYGGFGNAPKFPSPHNLLFLMKYFSLEKDVDVLEMVEGTLEGMYKGGLFDHIGFGFSRYSTDEKWLVPHFEKMLYDNAMLTIAYLEAYQLTKKELYKEIAEKTIAYVLRELKDPLGGFYSAQDADSEGVEGKFYVFTPSEIIQLLGEEDGKRFNDYYDITEAGNFEGKNIPNLTQNSELEKEHKNMAALLEKVLAYRLDRMSLHKDDKILTSWNALMLVALIKAYYILQEEKYLDTAKETMDFIKKYLTNKEGRLLARYREGQADYLAYLDDYAFLMWAYIEMHQATFDSYYLEEAIKLNKRVIDLFWDKANTGFFIYGKDGETLITRPKDLYDGALPSGNSVMSYNLLKLSKLVGDRKLEMLAQKQLKLFARSVRNAPTSISFYMLALMFELYPSQEIIAVIKDEADVKHLKKLLSQTFSPNRVCLVKHAKEKGILQEVLENYTLKNDQTTYYVCENKRCTPPFNDIKALI